MSLAFAVLVQGLIILVLPLPKLVKLYMHYLALASLTAASLLSRHYVLNEVQEDDVPSSARSVSSPLPAGPPPSSHLHSLISISPQYALKFAREFR